MKFYKVKFAFILALTMLFSQVAFAADAQWLNIVNFEQRENYNLDRGEACKYLMDAYVKLSGKPLPQVIENKFSDVNAAQQPFVLQAEALGLVKGSDDGTFSPQDTLLREDWALMLNNLVKVTYPDLVLEDYVTIVFPDSVSEEALPAMRFAFAHGILEKKSNGTVGAKDTLSLKEAVQMLNRTVEAAPDFPVYNTKYETKLAYLTFDDSTSANTVKILDTLKKYDVKATFFLGGKSDAELVKRMVAEGHAIGNHTYSHEYYSIYASPESFWEDFQKQQDYLQEITGQAPVLLRFPGGSNNSIGTRNKVMGTITAQAKYKGYEYFDWNVDSGDATGKTIPKETIVNNVLNGAKDKSDAIILMHQTALKTTTAEALPEIIEGLKNMGFDMGVLTPDSYHPQFVK